MTRTPKQIAADKVEAPPMTDKNAKLREAEVIVKLERTIEQYRNGKPEVIIQGSHAQVLFALQDGRKDVLALHDALAAEKARADAAEAERDKARLDFSAAVREGLQAVAEQKARAANAETETKFAYGINANHEATISTLTEQLAEAREGRKKAAAERLHALIEWLNEHEDNPHLLIASLTEQQLEEARATLSRLEKQEGEA